MRLEMLRPEGADHLMQCAKSKLKNQDWPSVRQLGLSNQAAPGIDFMKIAKEFGVRHSCREMHRILQAG